VSAIITRNAADYIDSAIPVMSAEEPDLQAITHFIGKSSGLNTLNVAPSTRAQS
jgi:hypothetical protein